MFIANHFKTAPKSFFLLLVNRLKTELSLDETTEKRPALENVSFCESIAREGRQKERVGDALKTLCSWKNIFDVEKKYFSNNFCNVALTLMVVLQQQSFASNTLTAQSLRKWLQHVAKASQTSFKSLASCTGVLSGHVYTNTTV